MLIRSFDSAIMSVASRVRLRRPPGMPTEPSAVRLRNLPIGVLMSSTTHRVIGAEILTLMLT